LRRSSERGQLLGHVLEPCDGDRAARRLPVEQHDDVIVSIASSLRSSLRDSSAFLTCAGVSPIFWLSRISTSGSRLSSDSEVTSK